MAHANLILWVIFAFLIGAFATPLVPNLYLLFIPAVLAGFLFFVLTRLYGIVLIALLVGCTTGSLYCASYIYRHAAHNPGAGTNRTLDGTVVSDVRDTNRGRRELSLQAVSPHYGTYHVSLPVHAEASYGDVIRAMGSIRPPDTKHGTWRITASTVTVLTPRSGISIRPMLFAIRNAFLRNITTALPAREAALAAGLTIGDRAGFDAELTDAMAVSGTTHLVALSGYNIAIIVSSIGLLFAGRLRRKTVAVITIIFITLFVLLVGGEASIVRAAIMGSLMIIAREAGRIRSIHRAILFSAFCMCIIRPTVVHDIGFQLSFLSLLGVVYVLPFIKAHLPIHPNPDALIDWKEQGLTSFSAQAAVFPILLINFDQVSLSGIVANVLIVVTIPATMLFSALIGFVGWIFPPLAQLIAWASYPLLHYQISIIQLFAKISVPLWFPNTLSAVLLYYALLTWLVVRHYTSTNTLHTCQNLNP